jgi:Na+/proline symporter/nitrogen-specific signal transduction histidine kinase
MNSLWIGLIAVTYLGILFLIAYLAESSKKKGASIINNGYVYALSMAVYCTAWTYYGSVGRASTHGIEFLTIYLGPTLAAVLFWPVLRKIVRISKQQRISSLADLASTRYGKNFSIALLVTLICVLGIIPYIALQLKAISTSFDLLTATQGSSNSMLTDSTVYFTLLMGLFIMLYGTRSIDAAEQHEGLVAAIAFESIIKLIAFVAAGLFVTYGIFNGVTDIFTQAASHITLKNRLQLDPQSSYMGWFSMMLLSMFAVILLPRQFQVGVVENVNEKHIQKASWLFPLYLFCINLFVLPIALGGSLLSSQTGAEADLFVLSLPLSQGYQALSLFIFIGGFSAATSMIIVETIALTTMISNNIVLPLLFAQNKFSSEAARLSGSKILWIRRLSILLVLGLALAYDKLVAQKFSLVSTGLVSFAAVAQLAPAVLGGLYWKTASKNGAIAGMLTGFSIWFFTLVLPSMERSGLLPTSITTEGLFHLSWLKPESLFGIQELDPVSQGVFWSLFLNAFIFILTSIYSRKEAEEIYQASVFADVFLQGQTPHHRLAWKGQTTPKELQELLIPFVGKEKAEKGIQTFASRNKIELHSSNADPQLLAYTERILSGIIGSASAHILVSSVAKAESLSIDEVFHMLRESQQLLGLNKELRRQSTALTKAKEQLTLANQQLKAMDEVKDEFLYTVTHEIRTPLTSIRAMAEIMQDNPDLEPAQKEQFLEAIIQEAERLSHLITQVLNLERYESGRQKLDIRSVDMNSLLRDVARSTKALQLEKNIQLKWQIPDSMLLVQCDPDLIQQVVYNLLSNAIKFTPDHGQITLMARFDYDELELRVCDEGPGVSADVKDLIFDKFFQAKNQTLKKPQGSGLGLAICKKIIDLHQGKIGVESDGKKGACFIFTLPAQKSYSLNG